MSKCSGCKHYKLYSKELVPPMSIQEVYVCDIKDCNYESKENSKEDEQLEGQMDIFDIIGD